MAPKTEPNVDAIHTPTTPRARKIKGEPDDEGYFSFQNNTGVKSEPAPEPTTPCPSPERANRKKRRYVELDREPAIKRQLIESSSGTYIKRDPDDDGAGSPTSTEADFKTPQSSPVPASSTTQPPAPSTPSASSSSTPPTSPPRPSRYPFLTPPRCKCCGTPGTKTTVSALEKWYPAGRVKYLCMQPHKCKAAERSSDGTRTRFLCWDDDLGTKDSSVKCIVCKLPARWDVVRRSDGRGGAAAVGDGFWTCQLGYTEGSCGFFRKDRHGCALTAGSVRTWKPRSFGDIRAIGE